MIDRSKTKHIKDLTDDQLCALVARNETRKIGQSNGSISFSEIFHTYSDVKKSVSEKQEAKFERERRKKLLDYVANYLTVKDETGELTEYVVIE